MGWGRDDCGHCAANNGMIGDKLEGAIFRGREWVQPVISRADTPDDVSEMARPLHCEGVSWLQEAANIEAEQRHDTSLRGVYPYL